MDFPELSTREQVLRELESLAQGQHPDQQTPLMRFTRCPDWQHAAELIVGALNAASHSRRGKRLSAPPVSKPEAEQQQTLGLFDQESRPVDFEAIPAAAQSCAPTD